MVTQNYKINTGSLSRYIYLSYTSSTALSISFSLLLLFILALYFHTFSLFSITHLSLSLTLTYQDYLSTRHDIFSFYWFFNDCPHAWIRPWSASFIIYIKTLSIIFPCVMENSNTLDHKQYRQREKEATQSGSSHHCDHSPPSTPANQTQKSSLWKKMRILS